MSIEQRIYRTGYVILYPAIPELAAPEYWYLCDANGIIQSRGHGFNAEQCREMVTSGALVEHVRLLAGAVIYKLVE